MCNTSFLHLTNTTLLEIKMNKKAYNKSSDDNNDSDSKIFLMDVSTPNMYIHESNQTQHTS